MPALPGISSFCSERNPSKCRREFSTTNFLIRKFVSTKRTESVLNDNHHNVETHESVGLVNCALALYVKAH